MIKTSKLKAIACGLFALGTVLSAPQALAAGDHLITMQGADIRAFIDDVSMVTGKTFIVDPRVQGQVTISSQSSLSPAEVFTVFKDVLRVHGYTAIRGSHGEYRITLIQGAAQESPFVTNSGVSGQMATTVIRLNYTDASDAARLIKPVLLPQGQLTANAGGNVIVISDFPENLRKARSIIEAMDKDSSRVETVRLQNISALDAEDAMRALQADKPRVRFVAITSSNSLIMRGDAAEIEALLPVLASMDSADTVNRGAVGVIPLRFAAGENLVEILTTLLPAYAREGEGVPAVAHESASNSIIISASPETQAELESIIRRLDVRRPQVLVEAIIVEISDNAAQELGVQFVLGGQDGGTIPLVSTNYSRSAPNMLALAGAIAGDSATDSSLVTTAVNSLLGLQGGTFGIGTQNDDTLFAAILNAFETDKDTNILSTPFVTTLDNVPATFLVGQEIPITTGESIGLNTGANAFRTFERQEVGIKLEVLPQISEGDVIRLEIKQEVSSIAGVTTSLTGDFVTNKREIETTVLADDGEIIVLGGLIEDDEQLNATKVPILGGAPLIGPLFRSKGKSRERTNLMVFLRPKIIRNAADARPLTQQRLLQMRAEDLNQSGRAVSKFDEMIKP